jgi:hypothetical protein
VSLNRKRRAAPNIIQCVKDPRLFGPLFRDIKTWGSWFVFLRVLFGHALATPEELALFTQCTGRSTPPTQAFKEAWLIVGRRAGKSFIAALIAVFLACFRSYRQYLAPGERGVVVLIAVDRKQALVIFRYVSAMLNAVQMLAQLVGRTTKEIIELTNGIDIEIHTASFRAVRGRTVVAAVCDEIAFWRSDDSANPDTEILNALRPAMATIPNAMLIALSSPYARRGELYRTFERYHGRDDAPVLVWRAATRVMNPTISERTISDAFERDATAAATEWDAEFRSDLSAAIDDALVDAATDHGVSLREPALVTATSQPHQYRAFVDPAGGSGRDSYTVAISHSENNRAVLDALLEIRPPFSTDAATEQIAALLQRYGVSHVTGDRYGGDWPAQALAKHGITYTQSELTKSDIYLECIPLFSAGRVRLLDNDRLTNQLKQLERRTGRLGKDSIDHPPGGHDDVANAASGALWLVSRHALEAGETVAEFSHVADELNPNISIQREEASIFDRTEDSPILRGLM